MNNSVVVVGAGPAGATAARTLASAGVHVRLLDRAVFPRNKPCGGGISMRVLRRFPYLAPALSRVATHAVARLRLEGPDGHATIIESDRPAALLIRRVEFDALLVSLAVDAGVELISGVDIVQARQDRDRVELVARDGRTFDAPFVIAADGVNSVIARRLGMNRGWPSTAIAIDMMEETPRDSLRDIDPSTLWVSYGYDPSPHARHDGAAPEGYAYVFPKRDHVNIGIGYVLAHFREAIAERPYDLQRGFVSRLRERGLVAGESIRKNFTPFLIPIGGPLRQPGRGRVLLAGDAGGFVNAFTAEGIYYAMVTGDLAGRAIASFNGEPPIVTRGYRRACNYEIGAELRDSVLIQRYLFADRRRIAQIIAGASRERTTTKLILDFILGYSSYRALRRRLLVRSPVLAGRLMYELFRHRKK